jgi:hypothetical protein
MTRVLITGCRRTDDSETIEQALAPWLFESRAVVFVTGACPTGADAIAEDIIRELYPRELYPDTLEMYPAEDFGSWPQCGPIRNSHMVSLGADVCLAFPSPRSRGTKDCYQKAIAAGIRTFVYPVK